MPSIVIPDLIGDPALPEGGQDGRRRRLLATVLSRGSLPSHDALSIVILGLVPRIQFSPKMMGKLRCLSGLLDPCLRRDDDVAQG